MDASSQAGLRRALGEPRTTSDSIRTYSVAPRTSCVSSHCRVAELVCRYLCIKIEFKDLRTIYKIVKKEDRKISKIGRREAGSPRELSAERLNVKSHQEI